MPPKCKFTKEQIINAALDITRQSGIDAVTARAVAIKLDSSSKVIFSLFQNMEDLQKEVIKAAYECYLSFLQRDLEIDKYPQYKAMGMAYIHFAKEERELFKCLFMCDRNGNYETAGVDFEMAIDMIMRTNGISREKAELMHLEIWICVHGIATMYATSYLTLEWEFVSGILTDIYQGIRSRHLSREE